MATFRIYVTDALYSLGLGHKERYINYITRNNTKTSDNRSGEEIIGDIVKKFNLKIVDKINREEVKNGS